MKKNVLVTSLIAGLGHIMAKNAMIDTLKGKTDEYEIFEYDSKVKIYDNIYKLLIKFPKIYNKFYLNYNSLSKLPENVIYRLEKRYIKKILDQRNIDVVVTTHPFLSMVFDKLRKKYGYNYVIVNMVLDYGDQPGYILPAGNFDYCLVKDERTKTLNKKYFPEDKIFVMGTDVNNIFENYSKKSNYQIKKEFFDFAPTFFTKPVDQKKKNILFIGGSGWARVSKPLIKKLAKTGRYNVFVSCGRDAEFVEYLLPKENIFPFGFVDHGKLALIEAFVDVAVLTSFGFTTMFEIMNLKKYPLLVNNIISPNEETNLKVLDQYKIGLYEFNNKKMFDIIEDYIKNKSKYIHYAKNQAEFVEINKINAQNNYKIILDVLSKSSNKSLENKTLN